MTPPLLKYQPYYCEENIWQLLLRPELEPFGSSYALWITNAERACPMWSQRAAARPQEPIVWDYHVVGLTQRDAHERALIWDLDHVGALPSELGQWLMMSFPYRRRLPPMYEPMFRLIPSADYHKSLSTDRSHMKDERGRWRKPPPPWAAPWCAQASMNLERFLDLEDDFVGEVMTLDALCARFLPNEPR